MSKTPSFVRLIGPASLLRMEAVCEFFAVLLVYHSLFPRHWGSFAALFLVPDISLLLLARGWSVFAVTVYNVFHSYTLAILLGGFAVSSREPLLLQVAMIWVAHIGLDRALGFGLKYPAPARFTHMQRAANEAAPDQSVPPTEG